MAAEAPRVAVVGAGWAGIAAAVRATEAGARVTLFDMAAIPGGRARSVSQHGLMLDNGQHILIGAYARTLDLMRTVGASPEAALMRLPLALVDAQGEGLRMPPGPATISLTRAILGYRGWSWADRLSLIGHALGWMAAGFRCVPDRAVADWASGLPRAVRERLIDPLCVAALNTDAREASAAVFLRVLRDALFSGRGSADLLLPRQPLGQLLPEPALAWLERSGARIRLSHRVQSVQARGSRWRLDEAGDGDFDHVVLACSAREAARLAQGVAPAWAEQAAAFAYEPIITAWIRAPRVLAPYPMLALAGGPAQFAFDLGALDPERSGWMTLVVSGAGPWLERSAEDFDQALEEQLRSQLSQVLPLGWTRVSTMTEKRATFRCVPSLARPAAGLAPGLTAAGDHVEGPYPATLEGAVRSGEAAVAEIGR